MAFITTYEAFEGGELNISGSETEAVQERIDLFISKHEDDYLLKVLGYPLFKLLKAASGYPVISTGRFGDLLNGAEYVNNKGQTREFPGLKVATGNPIASYVWYYFTRDNVSFASPAGEVKNNTENASSASVKVKQMRAWNEMVTFTEQLWDFLDANEDTYPEFDICETEYNTFTVINPLNI